MRVIATAPPDAWARLKEAEQQARTHRDFDELRKLKEATLRELGIGVVLRQLAEAMGNKPHIASHRVEGNGEHALVYVYSNAHAILHVLDDRRLIGEGSRFAGWWRRKRPPHQVQFTLDEVKRWLDRRARKRAQRKQP